MRRSERAYEARQEAYRHVLEWALVVIMRVELTDPIVTFAGMPEPPDAPPDEVYARLLVDVGAFGSHEVDAALDAFREAVSSFYLRAEEVRTQRESAQMRQQAGGGEISSFAFQERDEAREAARQSFEALRTTIKDELAAL